jgi:hypothetical protein
MLIPKPVNPPPDNQELPVVSFKMVRSAKVDMPSI